MKYVGMIVLLAVLSIQSMLAQESSSQSVPDGLMQPGQMSGPEVDLRTRLILHQISFDRDLALADSFPRPRVRKLLPDNISWMEKGLWGEEGFFRTSGLASPLTPESRASELSLRRGMLVAHQIGGFVTLGLMASAAYTGQKIIDGNSGYRPYHQTLVVGTITTYTLTGLLAVLSPPPVIRRDEISTTTIHKTLAWVHAAGMIITPILGSMISRRSSSTQKEHIHQLSGYITLATYTASLITVTF
jgi:hypothetical protein